MRSSGLDPRGLDLSAASLNSTNLARAIFNRANLTGAILCGADITSASFGDARLLCLIYVLYVLISYLGFK